MGSRCDADDVRLLADVAEGRGEMIDSEQDLHRYPQQKETQRPFNEAGWNLQDMPPSARNCWIPEARAPDRSAGGSLGGSARRRL